MKHVILYVPGLGDKKRWLLWLQKQTMRLWRVNHVRVEMIPMRWADPIPLKPRFEKLLKRIDELEKSGASVSLVGTSAGASAVISAFVLRQKKIRRVVTICGKLQGDIPDTIKELNPCFTQSLEMLEKSVKKLSRADKKRIMTLYSPWDAIVPPDEALIDGTNRKEIKSPGHNPTCAYILVFKSRLIARFVRL